MTTHDPLRVTLPPPVAVETAGRPGMTGPEVVAQRRMAEALNGAPSVRSLSAMSDRLNARPAEAGGKGLPGQLKAAVEAMSGVSLDGVTVERGSAVPAGFGAHAIAQGDRIHLAPDQDRHLPHEAWHVVQQKQGRVRATGDLGGTPVNTDPALEREADVMGGRAAGMEPAAGTGAAPLQAAGGLTARAAGGGVTVSSAARAAGPSGAVLQPMLIKVTTKRLAPDKPRVVNSVEFAGRVPTTAGAGQGDHTVAEVLVEMMLQKTCIGKTHREIASEISLQFRLIDEEVITRFKTEIGTFEKLDYGSLDKKALAYATAANDPSTEGEDLNEMLANLLEAFLRLWNKRPGSAYLKSAGKTTGGGDEKGSKQNILMIAKQSEIQGSNEVLAEALVSSVLGMIDFKPNKKDPEDLTQAAKHIAMALQLTLGTAPELEFNNDDIMTWVVEHYAQKYGLDREQEGFLDGKVAWWFKGVGEETDEFETDGKEKPSAMREEIADHGTQPAPTKGGKSSMDELSE